jgi:hypothetical protein
MVVANTLTYYNQVTITDIKSFIVLNPAAEFTR